MVSEAQESFEIPCDGGTIHTLAYDKMTSDIVNAPFFQTAMELCLAFVTGKNVIKRNHQININNTA